MDRNDILIKFNRLLNKTIEGGVKQEMQVTKMMFQKAVELLSDTDIRKAKEFVECFEGTLLFNNYLTEQEAENAVSLFVNQDGSRGGRWKNPEEFFQRIADIGGLIEQEPYYNRYSLYAMANKFSSDQHNIIQKWSDGDSMKYLQICYDLAVSQLQDKDKPNFVRWYFNICD